MSLSSRAVNRLRELRGAVLSCARGSRPGPSMPPRPEGSFHRLSPIEQLEPRLLLSGYEPLTVVTFPDPILEAEIREELDLPAGDITSDALAGLTRLYANRSGLPQKITDLTGLEHCVNLTELGLNSNQISDLTPLATLTELQYL